MAKSGSSSTKNSAFEDLSCDLSCVYCYYIVQYAFRAKAKLSVEIEVGGAWEAARVM